MRIILWEFGDGTKITVETNNEEYINRMTEVVEDMAESLDTTVEVDEI